MLQNVSKEEWANPQVAKPLLQRALEITALREGKRIGEPDRGSLEQYLTFLKSQNPKFNPPKLDDFLVTDMLEEINRFDRDAVLKVPYKP